MRLVYVLVAAALLLCGLAAGAATTSHEGVVQSESMKGQIIKLEMDSHALRRTTNVFVYLPPGYDKSKERLPVVYMLHGNPGKAWDLFKIGHFHETTESLILAGKIHPLILVAADCFGAGGSHSHDAFLNAADGSLMAEDFVAHELPAYIDSRFRTIRSPNARALSGLSSGGYGAVNVGSKHPETFHIMVSHSGFFDPKDEDKYVVRMLGPEGPRWDANNPLKQVKNWRDRKSLHVYMDIGGDDESLSENRELSKDLDHYGIDHVFAIAKGAHEWSLWRHQLAKSIVQVDKWFH